MILVEWAPFDFTPDGRQRIIGLVISSTTPNPLPVDGTNVDKMRNDQIFAPGSVLHVTGEADVNWYVANECGVFEPSSSSGGGTIMLVDKEISANGTYEAKDDDANGYRKVIVDVPSAVLKTKNITDNGTYAASSDEADGYSSVTVELPLGTKSITDNGTYTASEDALKGYSSVTVELPLGAKTITENDTYLASDDDLAGYSSITVNVSGGGSSSDISGEFEVESGSISRVNLCMTIPPEITTVDSNTFDNVNDLKQYTTEITATSTLVEIDVEAFYGWDYLTTADLSNTSVTSIGNRAFQYSSLETVNFPSALEAIGEYAFAECAYLTTADLSNTSLTSIGEHAFYECTSLETVSFSSTLTSIGESAFESCEYLTTISFPSTLATIGNDAFKDCTSLMSITCSATTPPTITEWTLNNVPSDCAIYVPAASVNDYKAAQYWSVRAAYIQAIPS